MLWLESLTNPLLRYTDLEAVVSIAKKRTVSGWGLTQGMRVSLWLRIRGCARDQGWG